MKTTKRILLVLIMLFSVLSFGQKETITGTVLDETGFPIPGANVVVKGTKNSTSTDIDGKYSIRVKRKNKPDLTYSYVGYRDLTIAVGGKNAINVSLRPLSDVNEVIIPERGTVKKTDLTGPVATVSADDLKKTETKEKKITISGTVIDETGIPIPGVNILIKGTKNSTSTDFDGKYNIHVVKGKKIVFSYIGYETAQVTIGKSKVINFQMKFSPIKDDEIIVPGIPNYNREESE